MSRPGPPGLSTEQRLETWRRLEVRPRRDGYRTSTGLRPRVDPLAVDSTRRDCSAGTQASRFGTDFSRTRRHLQGQSALRPKKCLLARSRTLCDIVASRLALEWSPEQISGWLKDEFPHNSSLRVSQRVVHLPGPRPRRIESSWWVVPPPPPAKALTASRRRFAPWTFASPLVERSRLAAT